MYVARSVIGAEIVLAYRVQNLAKADTFTFTQITVRNQESIFSYQLMHNSIIVSLALIEPYLEESQALIQNRLNM